MKEKIKLLATRIIARGDFANHLITIDRGGNMFLDFPDKSYFVRADKKTDSRYEVMSMFKLDSISQTHPINHIYPRTIFRIAIAYMLADGYFEAVEKGTYPELVDFVNRVLERRPQPF